MPKVELIYHTGCPNLQKARDSLNLALAEVSMDRNWVEWNSDDPAAPDYAKKYGSPTILVDGKDVENCDPSGGGNSCRVYHLDEGKMTGVPTVEMIKKELTGAL